VNISGTDQAIEKWKNGIMNYDFFPHSMKTIW